MRAAGLTFDLYIPFANVTFAIPHVVYFLFAMFVIVACVNAVNLTDGIDGLATGVTMPVMLFFGMVALRMQDDAVAKFSLALFGGLTAFLCYNFHPARVFMGRYRLTVFGGSGLWCGICAGYAADFDRGRPGVHCRDRLSDHPGHLFQVDPWKAGLSDDAHSPPL